MSRIRRILPALALAQEKSPATIWDEMATQEVRRAIDRQFNIIDGSRQTVTCTGNSPV